MSVHPCKLLNFAIAIVLTQSRLAETANGCYRKPPNTTPCEPITLGQAQLTQIAIAKECGLIDALQANKTYTYQNQQPIVTEFTEDQKARILEVYRGLGRNQSVYDNLLWEPQPSNATRQRRSAPNGMPICPVQNIMQYLITAFNADGNPLQIVQFSGFQQWVLRQECKNSLSPQGKLCTTGDGGPVNIACHTIQRSVFLVAIRLDLSVTQADIDVQEVQVESCSSFV